MQGNFVSASVRKGRQNSAAAIKMSENDSVNLVSFIEETLSKELLAFHDGSLWRTAGRVSLASQKGWSAGSLTRACEGDAGHP